MAATLDQASRRAPSAAVAGMTMPPLLRRSPDSLSSCTSTRSCSIRIGVLSVMERTSARDAADQHDHGHEACDAARHLEDVLGSGRAALVDEEVLDVGDL